MDEASEYRRLRFFGGPEHGRVVDMPHRPGVETPGAVFASGTRCGVYVLTLRLPEGLMVGPLEQCYVWSV